MTPTTWTTEKIGQLAKAIEVARKECALTFKFNGQEMAVDYADAVLEYLTEAYAAPTIQ